MKNANHHDGLCGVFIGDGPCSCLVHLVEGLQKEVAQLKRERRGYQIMVKQVWQMSEPEIYVGMAKDGLYDRAAGNAACIKCGLEFVEHPQVPGYPTFHVNCAGEILKL